MYKSYTILAVVQARMDSTRLPNKMMLSLKGHPIAGWVLHRLKKSQYIDKIIFAIPDSPSNNVLEYYLKSNNCSVYRGSENDVLDRFLQASNLYRAHWIIRVCADNPLISAGEVDNLIEYFGMKECDYAYNHVPKGNLYPDGLGAEITKISTLSRLNSLATTESHREHLFNYLWEHCEEFSIATFNPLDVRLHQPQLKLDLDNMSDYERLLSYNITIDSPAYEVVAAALHTKDQP